MATFLLGVILMGSLTIDVIHTVKLRLVLIKANKKTQTFGR